MLRTQLPQVAAESHQHTQASKGGDHAVSSNLQYLFQEERIGFSRVALWRPMRRLETRAR